MLFTENFVVVNAGTVIIKFDAESEDNWHAF